METRLHVPNAPRAAARFRAFRAAGWGVVLAFAASALPAVADPKLPPRYRYAEMFGIARDVMTRKTAREFLGDVFREALEVNPELARQYGFTGEKIKGFTETQMMLLLQENPDIWKDLRTYLREVPADANAAAAPAREVKEIEEARRTWREKFRTMLSDPKKLERFLKKNNPLEPFLLEMPDGAAAYSDVKVFVNHPIYENGKLRAPDDLRKELIAFVDGARRKLVFNVFDFDSMALADALVRAHRRGVEIRGGIDAGVIEVRPEVKAVYEKLRAAGIPITAVDSVGLNHQKLMAVDYDVAGEGRVSLLSGNYTDSCIGHLGDFTSKDVSGLSPRDLRKAIPNANHMITLRSDALAILIDHEISKSVDLKLRGREFPLSGAYQVMGDGKGLERKWMIMAFTPNGGLDSINKNFIARVLRETEGAVTTVQFAASAPEVEAAFGDRALAEIAAGREFDFLGVGDRPFAMQDWSIFLSMSDIRLVREGENKGYVELSGDEAVWRKRLGDERFERLVERIRVGPSAYGTFTVETATGPVQITAKLHHKIMTSGRVAIGGSFNFSVGAESNQEYIFAFFDDAVLEKYRAIAHTLGRQSEESVRGEARRRNATQFYDPHIGAEVEAGKAGRSTRDCKELLRVARYLAREVRE